MLARFPSSRLAAPLARHFSATMHGTTILCVKRDNKVCMIGDGQVSLGNTVIKPNATKVRRIKDNIVTGFAGSTADAFTLLERLEAKLDEFPGQGITRPCVELAKAWRSDKYLRRLEAVLLVADENEVYELTGNGDVLSAVDTNGTHIMAVGSGGLYALSAAKALATVDGLSAREIGERSMAIASELCVFTNSNYKIEEIDCEEVKQKTKEDEKKA